MKASCPRRGSTTASRSTGLPFFVAGATLLVGYKLLKIPLDSLLGLVAGLQTQPACLAFAGNLSKSDNTNLAYAGIYPAAMIAASVSRWLN